MIRFTQIPQQHAPLGQPIPCALEQDEAGTLDVRLFDLQSRILWAKRFAEVTEAAFDAAPCLRRLLRFTPAAGRTGFYPTEGRTVTALFDARTPGDAASAVNTPARTFLPGHAAVQGSALLTSMPRQRLIVEGGCDELTLVTEGACTMAVTARGTDAVTGETFRSEGRGLHVFRLDLRDYPEAQTLTLYAGACGAVDYSVVPASEEGMRLAWRSRAGSIEHYAFPVVRTTQVRVEKQRAEGPDGRTATAAVADREAVLVSAYESRAVLEALTELLASPEVWQVESEAYVPVDVLTDEAVVQRHGTLSCLELTIRPKTRTPWN